MSDINELRVRVEAAEEQFGLVDDRQRKYGARLLDLMNAVEGGLSKKQSALEQCMAELERITAENEQLRGMLQTLLLAIESNSEDRLDDTMHSLDAMVTALTGSASAAAPAEAETSGAVSEDGSATEPEEVVATGSEAVLVEDASEAEAVELETSETEAAGTEAGELDAGEMEIAEAAIEAPESEAGDEVSLETSEPEAAEPETAEDATPQDDAPEIEAVAEADPALETAAEDAPEMEAAAEDAALEVSETDAEELQAADTAEAAAQEEAEAVATEADAGEPDGTELEAAELETTELETTEPEVALEPDAAAEPEVSSEPEVSEAPEPETQEPVTQASRSPVGDIIARISEKTKDFPSEEVVMASLAEIEAGVTAAEGETPTLDSEFDEEDFVDRTAAAAS